jgi:hypothetical protein
MQQDALPHQAPWQRGEWQSELLRTLERVGESSLTSSHVRLSRFE